MRIAAVLPHTFLYGGVKRFFELGRIFIDLGHEFTIYTPDGKGPDWIQSKIKVLSFDYLEKEYIDIVFFTDKRLAEFVLKSKSKYKVFYHVREKMKVRKIVKDKRIITIACSTNVVKYDKLWYGVTPFLAAGGINTKLYTKKEFMPISIDKPITIMAYGRLAEKIKGTQIVVNACEMLYKKYPNLRLILFDSPQSKKMEDAIKNFKTIVPHEFFLNHPVEKNLELYHKADIFVSAETIAGWANTVVEAMASGVPVIATKSGTLDLIKDDETGIFVRRNKYSIAKAIEKLIRAPEKAMRLADNARSHVEKFDWEILAQNLIQWYDRMEKDAAVRN